MKASPPPPLCGIIPAAGGASRVQPLPCSKEIFPIGFSRWDEVAGPEGVRPRVAADYLLERMQAGGAEKVFLILSQGKWDIPQYFGAGERRGIPLAYLLAEVPYGAPFSVRQALPFVKDATILFGFPDIVFKPVDAYQQLLSHQQMAKADVTLGLFPATDPTKMDMVALDSNGRVAAIEIKPLRTVHHYTWLIATWTAAFSAYLERFLRRSEAALRERYLQSAGSHETEYYMGHVLKGALADGMTVAAVCFKEGRYIDIGTPGDLHRAVTAAHLIGE
jgi:glucose-1-phosphate thymidylyltransferase